MIVSIEVLIGRFGYADRTPTKYDMQDSIDVVQKVIDRKRLGAADLAKLQGVQSILQAVQDKLPPAKRS